MNKPTIVQVNLDRTKAVKCSCGSEQFEQVTYIREVPGILSPTMKPENVFAPAYRCCRCKKVMEFGKKSTEAVRERHKFWLKIAEIATGLIKFLRK
jgi:hypothetical protein